MSRKARIPNRKRRTPRRRIGMGGLTVQLRRSGIALIRATRQTRARIFTNFIVFAMLLSIALLVFGAVAWPLVQNHLEAISILDHVSGQPVPRLVGHFIAAGITTKDLTVATESGPVRARLYLPPGSGSAPALIVIHGVHHLGIDEPRLRAFAAAMANCGIRVLTPELPDIKDYHIDSGSVKTIGEITQWYAARTGGPVGVMGLSFSGGLSLLAAADPLYKPSFKFVFAVGSQDSMERVAQYYRTNRDLRPNGTTELLPAHEYGPLVLEYEHVEDFVPQSDIAGIRAVLRAHLYEDKPLERLAAARLDPRQRLEAKDLMDPSSPHTRALIADSIAKHALQMDGLSPESHLAGMSTPVYLLHGEADNIIPSAETLWMARELPSVSLQAMLVSPVISHLEFGEKPDAWDEWKLIHFFALVLHATHAPTGRTPWI
jgi:dienelactone hydrolase